MTWSMTWQVPDELCSVACCLQCRVSAAFSCEPLFCWVSVVILFHLGSDVHHLLFDCQSVLKVARLNGRFCHVKIKHCFYVALSWWSSFTSQILTQGCTNNWTDVDDAVEMLSSCWWCCSDQLDCCSPGKSSWPAHSLLSQHLLHIWVLHNSDFEILLFKLRMIKGLKCNYYESCKLSLVLKKETHCSYMCKITSIKWEESAFFTVQMLWVPSLDFLFI